MRKKGKVHLSISAAHHKSNGFQMHAYRPSQNWGLVVELIEPHFTLEWFGPGTNRQGFWLEGGSYCSGTECEIFEVSGFKKRHRSPLAQCAWQSDGARLIAEAPSDHELARAGDWRWRWLARFFSGDDDEQVLRYREKGPCSTGSTYAYNEPLIPWEDGVNGVG